MLDSGVASVRAAPARYALLFVATFAVFSGYANFDLPSITSMHMKEPPLSLSNTQLGLLFSVYAVPNSILPLLSSPFLRWTGLWRGVLIISALKSSGVVLTSAGVAMASFPVMLLGRVLYGLGGESLYVAIDVLTTSWFLGSELGFSYGVVGAAGQAGSVAASYAVPPLAAIAADPVNVAYALGAVLAVLAVALLFAGWRLDSEREQRKAGDDEAAAASAAPAALPDAATQRSLAWQLLHSGPLRFLGFNHLWGLSLLFWCHVGSIALFSGSYFTFLAFGNDFFQAKYGLDDTHSGYLVGGLSLCSVVLSPLAGLAFDKLGGSEAAACVAMATSAVCFGALGFTQLPAGPVALLMGVCYGVLSAALYPSVAEAVPEESFLPVYAILVSMVNAVLAATTLLAGWLSDGGAGGGGDGAAAVARPLRPASGAAALLPGRLFDASQAGGLGAAAPGGAAAAASAYAGVFALFAAYCALGVATTGYPLYVWLHGGRTRLSDGGGRGTGSGTTGQSNPDPAGAA